MNQRRKFLFMGVGCIAFVVIGMVGFFKSVAEGDSAEYQIFYANFKDVGSLKKGDELRYLGIPIGKVEDIKIQGQGRGSLFVQVELKVDPQFEIFQESSLSIKTTSIMGDMYLALEQGFGLPLKAGDVLVHTQRALSIEAMLDQIIRYAKSKKKHREQDSEREKLSETF